MSTKPEFLSQAISHNHHHFSAQITLLEKLVADLRTVYLNDASPVDLLACLSHCTETLYTDLTQYIVDEESQFIARLGALDQSDLHKGLVIIQDQHCQLEASLKAVRRYIATISQTPHHPPFELVESIYLRACHLRYLFALHRCDERGLAAQIDEAKT